MIKKLFDPEGRLYKITLNIFCAFFSVWMFTVRREFIGNVSCLDDDDESFIIAFWHNQVLALSYVFERGVCEKSTGMASKSRDGQMISDIMISRGFSVIRGSAQRKKKDKGGAVAFIKSLKVLREPNKLMCIVPDGPRGPIYEAQPGVMMLAVKSQKKLVPIGARYSASFKLPTWDKLYIPLPFSKMTVEFGEGLVFEENTEASKQEFTQALNKISQLK
ncbi:3-Deoxy-D-manno-octulosonic-acid transferase [Lentisphaera araneosa HTCC2155]|uniref:3-Deoxy-D-manno-octulosonic-acid transferase n=1 Tax=Lentisphaera araneosa HTCC2155 TaxID=313628 RepID=A6DTW5_9BACT|nr:lysophospholipid acyltransferase family protein [Lentisphaera araneosa]EDM24934.1 3-Deoxy-D-manno-octulosonic-acid transferase [Lentisphaera araneosa HTCC2155]